MSTAPEPADRSSALSSLTTLRVGGPARTLVTVTDEAELVDAFLSTWADGEPWLVLGGGSNVVVSDAGFDGTVIHLATRGVEHLEPGPGDPPGRVRLRVAAGESWDGLVEFCVQNGLSGIEALSGIPGQVGAAPVQNIGAYGQELASVVSAVDFLDFETGERQRLHAAELGFGYRTSVFKKGLAGVIVSVDLDLEPAELGAPVEYAQLASALGVDLGDRMPVADVRRAVLDLRASKGMVLDPADPDSVSVGSFFTNPIVTESFARTLPPDAPRWLVEPEESPTLVPLSGPATPAALDALPPTPAPAGGYEVKLSAAWLIEHAGIRRGFALPGSGAAISSKHTLAIVNQGSATADDVAELARFIQWRVQSEFGVNLSPEPTFIGFGPAAD